MSEEFVDTTAHTGGALEKRKVWSAWAQKHLKDLRLAKKAGLFPKKEGWRNVVEHLLVVNAGSVLLARKVVAAGHLVNIELVDTASLLHDIAKRRKKEKGEGRESEHEEGMTDQLLSQGGHSDEVIQAAYYTGRVPEIYFEDIEQDQAVATKPIEHLIVAYADARVRNTQVVSLEEARDKNKEKVPQDASFYDKWYRYYQKVEKKIFSLTGDSFLPSDFSEKNVFEMVKEETGLK